MGSPPNTAKLQTQIVLADSSTDAGAMERLFLLEAYTHEKMTENLTLYPALGWEETGRGEQSGYRRVFFRKNV